MNANEREHATKTTAIEGNAPLVAQEEAQAARPRWMGWLNVVAVLLLFLAAFVVRIGHTHGDLWQDEAEYALASVHPVADQRWDHSDVASEPLRLVRLRHYHPPMTAYLLRMAQLRGTDERSLRIPFVVTGSLVVCLTYLCGLRLFAGQRDISLACAVIVLVTPLQIRAASHAIPWAEISLGIMAVLWTLLEYIHAKRRGWLIGTCGILGWLFCTTESFFPILLAVLFSLPFVLDRTIQTGENSQDADTLSPRRRTSLRQPRVLTLGASSLTTAVMGALVFLGIVLMLWPAGLFGGAWRNIQHYAHLPADTISAVVGGVSRRPIPKWAYLYWFSHDYKPYFTLYVFGIGAMMWQIAQRRLSRSAGVLLILALVEIGVAHVTVEFGPQYLAHCLPLLTLMTGFGFCELALITNRWQPRAAEHVNAGQVNPSTNTSARFFRGLIPVMMLLTCVFLARWHVRPELRLTDEEAQVSRWPEAARFLAQRRGSNDRLFIGPQPVVVPRWYLTVVEKLPLRESQVGELPQGRTRLSGLQRMKNGDVRFAVVNSTFDGSPAIDADVSALLAAWPIVYRSHEPTGIPSRLIIYEHP